jgi:hypothetical protein
MDKLKLGFIAAVAALLMAGPIKNWTSNEYITYTDLNNNFNHLHASVGHGHGPVITAADISSNAGIRPEQTTFGNSIGRNLVFSGTFQKNPDAGTAYLLVNAVGSLNVTATKTAGGVDFTGAAQAGALIDAGTKIYTTTYNPLSDGSDNTQCYTSTVTLSSPFFLSLACYDVPSLPTVVTSKSPVLISVEVYNNKVQ